MSEHAHHHPSAKVYVITLGALLCLTAVTVGAAYVNFGSPTVNIVIAMAIATLKATLVALFFMHLKDDNKLNAIIFVSSLIFLGIFLTFSLFDVQSRDKVIPYGLRIDPQAQKKKADEEAAKKKAAAEKHAAPAHH